MRVGEEVLQHFQWIWYTYWNKLGTLKLVQTKLTLKSEKQTFVGWISYSVRRFSTIALQLCLKYATGNVRKIRRV